MIRQIVEAKKRRKHQVVMHLRMEELSHMSVAELKRRLAQVGLVGEGCIEKADLVRLLLSSPRVDLRYN